MREVLFVLSLWSYILVTVFFTFTLLKTKDNIIQSKKAMTSFFPFLVLTIAIAQISLESKYVYFINLFGAISFFTMVSTAVLLALYFLKQIDFNLFIVIFTAITLFFTVAFIPVVYNTTTDISPLLKTPFLIVHVFFAVMGEVMFFIGFIVCMAILFKKDTDLGKTLKRSLVLNIIGYILFVFGAIFMGALWAKNSWGRYWGWDPKEIWSLVTIVIYSFYFIIWKLMKNNSKVIFVITIMAFSSMLITILGVSLFGNGLHSYK